MHVHLDPVGGIAGDMFAAAVLDAWPELEAGLIAALERAGILRLATVRRCDHIDHALSGSRFEVRQTEGNPDRHHSHRDLQDFIQSADLAGRVRERALHLFDLLAGAESKVHGVAPEEVSFHEVGHWDSIADIVSAAWLIDALEDATWSCEALPLGRGRVATAHGSLPLPAPATTVLLEGLPTFQDEHRGERVTPTGAAIVRHLDPSFGPIPGVMRLARSGTGFGTSVFEDLSNTLRLLVFERASTGYRADRVTVCSFEVDDQTGEDMAVALDRVRAVPGVLDVTQSPISGKKGRLAVRVQVLAEPDAVPSALDACFRETTTLGIRWQTVERAVLERHESQVQLGDRTVAVKQTRRPGEIVTAKAGMDDLAGAHGGREKRELLRRRAETVVAGPVSDREEQNGK
ncbi:MAG: LarC family nickel insertion protein [bacterium]|nr:LarC family nickel insertion protein [bacterium]